MADLLQMFYKERRLIIDSRLAIRTIYQGIMFASHAVQLTLFVLLLFAGLDLLTILWTTEVLVNKIINEQQPRVVYFASYGGKRLLMITNEFCSISPSVGWVT